MRMGSALLAMLAWLLLTGASTGLQVSVHSDKLDIVAKDVPLVDVLSALDEQAKITFSVIGEAEINQLHVSEEFKDLPLDQAIARLLKGLSYSLLRDKEGRLSKVIILGKDEGGGVNLADNPRGILTGTEESDTASEVTESPSEVSATEAAQSSEAVEDELAQRVKAARIARTPEEKAEALRRLGDFQDSRTLEALQPALEAEQTEVRRAALEAMRWGTVYDPKALKEVRKLAEEDADPQVRRSALEVIVCYDTSSEARELLERHAQGGDKVLRDFAIRELQRMDEEATAAAAADEQIQQVEQENLEPEGEEAPASSQVEENQ